MTDRSPARGRRRNDPRRAAIGALAAFAADHEVRVLDALDLEGLSHRDAGLAREIALGAVRRQSLLDAAVLPYATRGLPARADVLAALRVGVYQLLMLERVPHHAAVDETVRSTPPRARGFVNAVLRRVAGDVAARPADPDSEHELALGAARCWISPVPLPHPEREPVARLALWSSVPEWLISRWVTRYGVAVTEGICRAAVATPSVYLRSVGRAVEELAAELAEAGVQTESTAHPLLLRWSGGAPPFGTASFERGAFVVQDPTALRTAEAVGAQPGETVLDLCAAPGTKATWLAEAVGADGRVLAYDVIPARAELVAQSARRLRLPQLQVVHDPNVGAGADRVLVDAPCSNSGVMARRVEVRHRLREIAFVELARTQRDLLDLALRLVRPGGTVLYSTCAVEPEENAEVVAAVVARWPGVTVAETLDTLPATPEHDGGFLARLVKPA